MLYSKVLLEGTAYEKQLDKMMEEKERHGGINAVSKETQTKDKVKNNEKGQSS